MQTASTALNIEHRGLLAVLPRRVPPRATRSELTDKLSAKSPKMREIATLVGRLSNSDVTVAILGETGSGKDVVAHALHDNGCRAAKPFVVFDCGAVPPNLVESELYGHERGAFTGAHADHQGAFERARGGTLFIDELGELPLELQPRLLRVLDNRLVRRVGGSREHQIDVRIVCATNRNLAQLVSEKKFREDLYFRLAAAVISLPPLRERKDDLPALLSRLLVELGRPEVDVPPETFEFLSAHAWPGNVRELRNTLDCALAFVDGCTLEPHHIRLMPSTCESPAMNELALGGRTLESLENVAISQTLALSHGNKLHAARVLGIAPSTLYEKLKRYGIA